MGCDDCGECAACSTLVMGPFEDWQPVTLREEVHDQCVFCRRVGRVDHYTVLGMSVGTCCA